MESTWYYMRGAERVGPVTLPELQVRLRDTPNGERTPVCAPHLSGWQPASKVAELEALFRDRSFAAHLIAAIPRALLATALMVTGWLIVPAACMLRDGPANPDPEALARVVGGLLFQYGVATAGGAVFAAAIRRGRSLLVVFLAVLALVLLVGFMSPVSNPRG